MSPIPTSKEISQMLHVGTGERLIQRTRLPVVVQTV